MITKEFKNFEKKRIEAELKHKDIVQMILDGDNEIDTLKQSEYSMMWRDKDRRCTPKGIAVRYLAKMVVEEALAEKKRR